MKILRLAFAFVLLALAPAHAQQATERYIPIGKSPGLSGKYTTIGTVEAIDVTGGIITMSDDTKTYTVQCSEDTEFWLDRTRIRLTNLTGTLADCEVGRLLEVKYVENDVEGRRAAWVKVQVSEPE